jgi:hypothetical protein
MRNEMQKRNLHQLAQYINTRQQPLGVGLKNQCWAGLAIDVAKSQGYDALSYFGITFSELKEKIKLNNMQRPAERNRVMADISRKMAEG